MHTEIPTKNTKSILKYTLKKLAKNTTKYAARLTIVTASQLTGAFSLGSWHSPLVALRAYRVSNESNCPPAAAAAADATPLAVQHCCLSLPAAAD